jgi:hypothetical protein
VHAFLHIPKTGGTALIQQIRSRGRSTIQLDGVQYYHLRNRLGAFECTTGHIPLFVLEMENIQRDIFSVFREPHARIRSLINHFASEPHHTAHQILQAEPRRWIDAFDIAAFSFEFANFQTRLLGFRPQGSVWERAKDGNLDAFLSTWAEFLTFEVGEEHVENALGALQGRINCADYELLPFSLATNLSALTSGAAGTLPRVRAPSHRVDISEQLQARIAETNRYDLILYSAAKPMALDQAADEVLRCGELMCLPGAPKPFLGLHQPEPYLGNFLRWTNGSASLPILLPANSGSTRLRVQVWNVVTPDPTIAIWANGWDSVRSNDSDGNAQWDLTRRAPQGAHAEETVLRIESDTRTFYGDERLLGAPLKSVRVL